MRIAHFLFIITLFFTACSEKSSGSDSNPDDPTDLTVDVIVYDDGSGTVVFNANAEKVSYYQLDVGVNGVEPITNETGYFEYTYKDFGTYRIEVRAVGVTGRYLKKEQSITVVSNEPVPVGLGYSTPLQYEGMNLVWNDEFNGNQLNGTYWSNDLGTGCPNLCGWGNNELQTYRAQNTWVEDGVLKLEARNESFDNRNYTSGKVVTRNKLTAHFGRIDIRAVLPQGQGIWPALWMLGQNHGAIGWPKCGEIDIMEMVGGQGRENTVSANAFWYDNGTVDNPKRYTLAEGTFADEFHVFSIIWDEDQIRYFVDDIEYHSISINVATRSEFQLPFYLIFNVAVGGNWPGSPDETTSFPTQMQVDYIRVFEME